jgi:hypothetical protein
VKLAGEHGKTNVLNYFLTNPHIPFHWNQDENVLIDFANAAFVGACTKGQFVFVKEFLENPEHKKLLNSESYCEGILRAARNNQVKILDFLLTDENRKFNINWTHEELFKEICKYQCSEALTYLINDFKIGKNPLIEDILANRENGKKLNFNTEFLSKAENLFNSRYLNVEPSKPKM